MKTEAKKIPSELEPIKIGLTDEEYYVFHYRRLFAHVYNEANNKFTESADLKGFEKGQQEFEIIKENLTELLAQKPEKWELREVTRKVKDGSDQEKTEKEFVQVKAKGETTADFLSEFFADYTPENEAILLQAWFEIQKKQLLIRYF